MTPERLAEIRARLDRSPGPHMLHVAEPGNLIVEAWRDMGDLLDYVAQLEKWLEMFQNDSDAYRLGERRGVEKAAASVREEAAYWREADDRLGKILEMRARMIEALPVTEETK